MITRVLISGGKEVGGLNSFAKNIQQGFLKLHIPAKILVSLRDFLGVWRDWRDPTVLKILSTWAVFLSPLCKNSICVSHGIPRVDSQGKAKVFLIFISLLFASKFSKLVAVSYYVKAHISAFWGVDVHRVIYNPVNNIYFNINENRINDRKYITYVGRLHFTKNVDKLIPVLKDFLNTEFGNKYQVMIVGDGPDRSILEKLISSDPRFVLAGECNEDEVREILENTEIFFSGCETEALGISYIEALLSGCKIIMPACGGGLEIAHELLGEKVFLFSIDFDRIAILDCIYSALNLDCNIVKLDKFRAENVALQYINIFETGM